MGEFAKAADLPAETRDAVRDLILVLADTKRLLGMRFGNWILGAPELEAGIACASMAQDEWGHARLLYSLLRDFGDDVDRLEHGRDAEAYRNMDALDYEPESWPALVAVNALVDAGLTVQLESLTASSYVPLRQRVQKLLEEEHFHSAHGAAWLSRIAAAGDDARSAMREAVETVIPSVLRWFGPDSDRAATLQAEGLADATGSALRERFIVRVHPLLALTGARKEVQLDFSSFDESSRRTQGTTPDPATIRQIRGDKNRAFLMD
jgi:ring-1,2-phenylacetyl-CoA epoxidase subunit PaaC